MAQYERILLQHGLLPGEHNVVPLEEEPMPRSVLQAVRDPWREPRPGRLLAGEGKTRYIDGDIWEKLADDEMEHISEDEGDEVPTALSAEPGQTDPLTDAFIGRSPQNLLAGHPAADHAMLLWRTYVENVEPIMNMLHLPTTSKMMQIKSQSPECASKAEECLMFSIYFFAVYTMTAEDCAKTFNQSHEHLIQHFRRAAQQAFVNASFLKTSEMMVLQGLTLYLTACRYHYDPHTYWMLTGTALRIGQRMGVHKDGEKLGLPPFDVQMRRRLLYQLVPLDGIAGQMSGAGMFGLPPGWEVIAPANINDEQIWPGMSEPPGDHRGVTDKIFCLTRATIGAWGAKMGRPLLGAGGWGPDNVADINAAISTIESEIEEKYIRYCDILNPLHILTVAFARAAFTAVRMRIPLSKLKAGVSTETDKRELLEYSYKILDTAIAAYQQPGLRKYLWFVKTFFAWGTWDALIIILTELRQAGAFSPSERDAAWRRMEQVYVNHEELLLKKRALHIAIGRVTLKAWDANPPSNKTSEPEFIARLKAQYKSYEERQAQRGRRIDAEVLDPVLREATTVADTSPSSDGNAVPSGSPDRIDLGLGADFNLDAADWMFWDQLIKDYEKQG